MVHRSLRSDQTPVPPQEPLQAKQTNKEHKACQDSRGGQRRELILEGARGRVASPVGPELSLGLVLRQRLRLQFAQELPQVLRLVEFPSTRVGELGKKVVIRRLAQHLSLILIDHKAGLGR